MSVRFDPGLGAEVNGNVSKMEDAKVEIRQEDSETTRYNIIRNTLAPIVMSFGFRIFGIVLIIVDLVLVIVDLAMSPWDSGQIVAGVSLGISIFFLADVLLHVYVEGHKVYFSSKLNIADAFIVGITLVVTLVYTCNAWSRTNLVPRTVAFLRLLRIIILVRVFRLASQKRELEKVTRRMISENKRRYQKHGFDLDLTYVTDRVIAMSFPSSGKQALYRNPIKEVVRFLDTRHRNQYKVYNLCSENGYNPHYFHYRVERVYIDDHNVPTLEDMLKFTASVRSWMSLDPDNVIAIHCKGGKGRTGTMICIWLIDSEQCVSAKESLDFFGERRTDKTLSSKFQGVETPSQSRYVGYYEIIKTKYNRQLPPPKTLRIKSIRIHSIAGVGKGDGSDLSVRIIVDKKEVFHCSCAKQDNCRLIPDVGNNATVIGLLDGPVVQGDVKVMFDSSSKIPKGYEHVPFYLWFNTSFISENKLFLSREELDNPHKRKTWALYKEDFGVTLFFADHE